MAHILSLACTPADLERHPEDHFARRQIETATLIEGHGIAGDARGGNGYRQLNMMLAETVAELRGDGFKAQPGQLGEQMVIAGLEGEALTAGTRLRLGEVAVIEIVRPREPCRRFSKIQGKPIDVAVGRIGYMARVVQGGEIAVGTPVSVEAGQINDQGT